MHTCKAKIRGKTFFGFKKFTRLGILGKYTKLMFGVLGKYAK